MTDEEAVLLVATMLAGRVGRANMLGGGHYTGDSWIQAVADEQTITRARNMVRFWRTGLSVDLKIPDAPRETSR